MGLFLLVGTRHVVSLQVKIQVLFCRAQGTGHGAWSMEHGLIRENYVFKLADKPDRRNSVQAGRKEDKSISSSLFTL